MSRRFKFNSGRLAAAFVAVLSTYRGAGHGYIPINFREEPVILEVDHGASGPNAWMAGTDFGAAKIESLSHFEAAVTEVLDMRPATDRLFLAAGENRNPTSHGVTILRNGNIGVGCQSFNKEQADRISAAISLSDQFTMIVGGVKVICSDGRCNFGSVGGIDTRAIKQLIALRQEFLSKQTAPTTPFRLFS